MEGTGLDKMARAVSPVPSKYYDVADVLGMAHKTPLLEVRFRNYPPYLKLADHQTIETMGSDSEFHNLLINQASAAEIVKHPITTQFLSDQGLLSELLETDFDDLKAYLETGESPKYADELLLGRWTLDPNATLNYAKKNIIGVKARQIRDIKAFIQTHLVGTTMVAYPDQTFEVSGRPKPEEKEPDPNDQATPLMTLTEVWHNPQETPPWRSVMGYPLSKVARGQVVKEDRLRQEELLQPNQRL